MREEASVTCASRVPTFGSAEVRVEISRNTIEELKRLAPGRVLLDEPMARHTSFGLGGPADIYVEPPSPESFRACSACLDEAGLPVMLLGRGTNVLVRRGGIDGAVLSSAGAFSEIERTGDMVRAGSGVGLGRLIDFCAESGLKGLEALSGIPGSVGGAVVTNAGSFGTSIADSLLAIRASRAGEEPLSITAGELDLGYREAHLPQGMTIEDVELRLEPDAPDSIKERKRSVLERKWKAQPSGMRSAGCVFKNPAGRSAGQLIDSSGLKGMRVGGAVVSDLHANFILNDRGATADDVEELVALVRDRVLETSGTELELEIEIAGRRVTT